MGGVVRGAALWSSPSYSRLSRLPRRLAFDVSQLAAAKSQFDNRMRMPVCTVRLGDVPLGRKTRRSLLALYNPRRLATSQAQHDKRLYEVSTDPVGEPECNKEMAELPVPSSHVTEKTTPPRTTSSTQVSCSPSSGRAAALHTHLAGYLRRIYVMRDLFTH